jgi:hypothetical protein
VPDGIFCWDPDDLSVKRSIRTNNPGALDDRPWQHNFPGYAGKTFPDGAGNVTSIYATPEHGCAAWYHLISARYGFGDIVRVGDLAKRYAGETSDTAPAVLNYVAGWRKGSGNVLDADSILDLKKDEELTLLARAMFFNEIGGPSPLHDDQIVAGVNLYRSGGLPPH